MDTWFVLLLFGLGTGYFLSKKISPFISLLLSGAAIYLGFYSGGVMEKFAIPYGLGISLISLITLLKRHGGMLKETLFEAKKIFKEERREEKDLAEVFGDVNSIERGILSEYESIYRVAREVKTVDQEIVSMYKKVFEFIDRMLKEIDTFISRLKGFWGKLNRQMVYRWWITACARVKKDLEETLDYMVKTIPETALSFEEITRTLRELDETTDKLLDRVFRFINDVKKADIDELKLARELEKYSEQLERLEVSDILKEVRTAYRAEEEKVRELGAKEQLEKKKDLKTFKDFERSVSALNKIVLNFRKTVSYYLREVKSYGESVEELVKALDKLEEGVRKLKGREGVEKWLANRTEVVRKNVQAKAYDVKSEFHNIADKEYLRPHELISAFWKGVDEMSKSLLAEISSFEKDLDQLEMDYRSLTGELRATLNTVQEDIKDLELYQKNVLEKLKENIETYVQNELKDVERVLRAEESERYVNRASLERMLRTVEALKAAAREIQEAINEDRKVSNEAGKLMAKLKEFNRELKGVFNRALGEIRGLKEELGVIASNIEKFRGAVAVRLREGIRKMDHLRELLEQEERAYEMLLRKKEMARGVAEGKEGGRAPEAPLPRAR